MLRRLRVPRFRLLFLFSLALVGVYFGDDILSQLVQKYILRGSANSTYSLNKASTQVSSERSWQKESTHHLADLARGVPDLVQLDSNSAPVFEELDMNYIIPKDVFYFWCEPRTQFELRHNFEFRHYLSVRSVFAYLKPYRVRFLYENEPIKEELSHDTWLQEIREQYPYFSTDKLPPGWCNEAQQNMEKYLDESGGIFVNEDVIIASGFADEQYRNVNRLTVVESGTNTTLLHISSRQNKVNASNTNCLNSTDTLTFVKSSWKLGNPANIRNSTATVDLTKCDQPSSTTVLVKTGMLVMVDTPIFPEQIWELDSEIGRQLRTVAYGKPDLAQPVPNFSRLAPNIAHVVWTNNDPMKFIFYLCVLSLLDVASFDKVYIHGDGPPTGTYWELIKEHPRLRLVKRTVIEGRYERIYGNRINVMAHVVDVLRLDILNRYGGLYVDTDAIFFRPLTRELRAYDAVVSPDITVRNGFPDTFQNGIMLGKPGAELWRLMLESNRKHYDDDWLWSCCVSIYRVKERHPTVVLSDPRLNTICNSGRCYPTWERRLRRYTTGQIAEVMKQWRNNTYAVHHSYPDLPEFVNHTALLKNNGTTLMGEIGLYVLEQAGKLDFFKNN